MSLEQQHPYHESNTSLYRGAFPAMTEYQGYYGYSSPSSAGDCFRLDNSSAFSHNENMNCGLTLQKLLIQRRMQSGLSTPLETLLEQAGLGLGPTPPDQGVYSSGMRSHQAVDNVPSSFYSLAGGGDHQPPSPYTTTSNSLGLIANLQDSLSNLRLAHNNYSESSLGAPHSRSILNYSLPSSAPAVNFAQNAAALSSLARLQPAAAVRSGRSGGLASQFRDGEPHYQNAARLEQQQQQQQQHYALALEEAAFAFRSGGGSSSSQDDAAMPAYSNSSMFGLADISARIRLEAGLQLPAHSQSASTTTTATAAATTAATPSSGGWNPLLSAAAPAVVVPQREGVLSSLSATTEVNLSARRMSSAAAGTATSVERGGEELLAAADVNPIEEYIFYSDDDEETDESGSSGGDDDRRAPPDGLQFSSSTFSATGAVRGVNGLSAKKKRSSSSSGKASVSLLHQRTAAALDADLRPPSPPPSAAKAAQCVDTMFPAAPLSPSSGAKVAMLPPLPHLPGPSRGMTKTTSWSQIVGNTAKPMAAAAAAAVPPQSSSSWAMSAVLPTLMGPGCNTVPPSATFPAPSPSPPPLQRGKSSSPPLPEFHRGPRVDPRWPVSQQVFLGPIPVSITWDEIRNTFYSRVSRNQILHTYVQSKPVNDVVYGQVVFDKTSLANKMLKEGPIKVRGHLIHMTSMKEKVNLEKRK